jgi:hypothetical protein
MLKKRQIRAKIMPQMFKNVRTIVTGRAMVRIFILGVPSYGV